MLTGNSQENQACYFAPIAFESKHQQDFEQSESMSEFSQNYRDNPQTTFSDGKYDGELDIEPQAYQWFEPIYRKGYLAGVTNRFNELFSA